MATNRAEESVLSKRLRVFIRIAEAFGDDPKEPAEALGLSLGVFAHKLDRTGGYSFQRPEIDYLASQYHLTNEGVRWLLLGDEHEPAGIPFDVEALKTLKRQTRGLDDSLILDPKKSDIPSMEELAEKLGGSSLEELIESLDEELEF